MRSILSGALKLARTFARPARRRLHRCLSRVAEPRRLSLASSHLPPPHRATRNRRLVGRTVAKFGGGIFDPARPMAIVTMKAMAAELRHAFGNKMHERMSTLPIHACYLLCTLAGALKMPGTDAVPKSRIRQGSLEDRFMRNASALLPAPLLRSSFPDTLSQLEAHGFVACRQSSHRKGSRTPRKNEIKLTVSLMVRKRGRSALHPSISIS